MTGAQRTPPLWMLLLLLLLLHQPSPLRAKRVVHIPAPFMSHIMPHIKVARALHEQGHQAWVAIPSFQGQKSTMDTSNVTLLQYPLSQDYEEALMRIVRDSYFSQTSQDLGDKGALMGEMCDEILQVSGLEGMVRDVRPDLLVLDNMIHVNSLMVLPYKLGLPFAVTGAWYDVLSTRVPYSSAASPIQISTFSDDMGFFERVQNMFMLLRTHVYHPFMKKDVVTTYAPEMPYISNHELLALPALWLIESDHVLDYPRPSLPNVKLIGGMSTGQPTPLPAQLQTFMDSATQGVVIVSFGSYVLNLPQNLSDKLMQVFQDLSMKVVFRSPLTSPHPSKVFTSRWLPQNSLLAHPNTKLFFSHCGNNGLYEALFHAVPLLCNPLYGDQLYNGGRVHSKGFGEVTDMRTATQEQLLDLITTTANDPRYRLAVSKASSLFRQLYTAPVQEAAKWLDHVMQYGADYMRYAGQNIPLYQLFAVDVVGFVFLSGGLMTGLLWLCFKMLWVGCCKRKRKTE